MNPTDLENYQTEIARQALAELDGHTWEWVQFCVCKLRSIDIEWLDFRRGGEMDSVRMQGDLGGMASRLREAMWTFETGIWHWMTLTLDKTTNVVRFEYHWDDDFTEWFVRPDDEAYLDDIRSFPRPWAAIPDWHPARAHYTEATWNAFVNDWPTSPWHEKFVAFTAAPSEPTSVPDVDDDVDLLPGGPRFAPDSPVPPEDLYAASQSAVAQAAAESIGDEDWDRAVFTLCLVADHVAAWIDVTRSGRVERIAASTAAIDAGRRLRELDQSPVYGSWSWLECPLDMATHEVTFEGHCDDFTGWEVRPGEQAYLDDLRAFPMPWWKIRDGHPARADYTEATWNAYRDSLGLPRGRS